MRLVPKSKTKKVMYYSAKLEPWASRADEIGTSPQAVADLAEKVAAARATIQRQGEARAAYLTATQAADQAVAAMAQAGGDIIEAIRARAATNGETIYTLASLPEPAAPSAVRTLGEPRDFRAALAGDGALMLTWKCASPRASGTVYQIWRSVGGIADFVFLGVSGKKKFTDATLPAGAAHIQYKIQATRSTATGPIAIFNVNVGGSRTVASFQVKHAA